MSPGNSRSTRCATDGWRDSSPQRSLPIVSVDSGLEFERLSGSGGTRSITLEPRAMYVYIPYRDQSQLPVFDSGIPDPNLIELFRPNRFVGIDRIGDENGLTLGLTSRRPSIPPAARAI